MMNEEIESCIQTLRFLENNFINDHGMFLNDKHPDNIEKIIRFLKEKRWIPCSERLPEDRELVLFSTKTDRVFEGRYFDDNTDRQWYSFRDDTFAWDNVVTAWMPLPEPYKESEE